MQVPRKSGQKKDLGLKQLWWGERGGVGRFRRRGRGPGEAGGGLGWVKGEGEGGGRAGLSMQLTHSSQFMSGMFHFNIALSVTRNVAISRLNHTCRGGLTLAILHIPALHPDATRPMKQLFCPMVVCVQLSGTTGLHFASLQQPSDGPPALWGCRQTRLELRRLHASTALKRCAYNILGQCGLRLVTDGDKGVLGFPGMMPWLWNEPSGCGVRCQ